VALPNPARNRREARLPLRKRWFTSMTHRLRMLHAYISLRRGVSVRQVKRWASPLIIEQSLGYGM
jgi:hypothetical protein